ncbi:MAG: hypothetical protein R3240_14405, partial [Gammaproteobacteria bacterium]|nr:hypothetical protein [Gammaproteobacteria bacterium]
MKIYNYSLLKHIVSILCFLLLFSASNSVFAEQDIQGVRNKIVIQVSTDDPRTQTIALNNAVNL